MLDVTCIDESVYAGALTYGRKYSVLAFESDQQPRKVKIQADNGRVRWYPVLCFDLSGRDIPHLETLRICDDLAAADSALIEVEVTLSNGQRRWCLFATPITLGNAGDYIDGTTILIHYGVPHLIIVGTLDEQVINQALRYIERNGKLFVCTQPIED
jgi:hypothetical protein